MGDKCASQLHWTSYRFCLGQLAVRFCFLGFDSPFAIFLLHVQVCCTHMDRLPCPVCEDSSTNAGSTGAAVIFDLRFWVWQSSLAWWVCRHLLHWASETCKTETFFSGHGQDGASMPGVAIQSGLGFLLPKLREEIVSGSAHEKSVPYHLPWLSQDYFVRQVLACELPFQRESPACRPLTQA